MKWGLTFRDSYTSLKLIRQKYLRAQIQALEEKKYKTGADKKKLAALQKELGPIQDFLREARKQRDAILKEIGMHSESSLAGCLLC